MATTQARPPVLKRVPPEAVAPGHRRTPPVTYWALIGGVVLAFQAYVMVKWVAGPNFEHVGTGPSQPPDWMKAVLISWQAIGIPLALGLLYFVLIRPWRRDGRVPTDGLLLIAFFAVAFQDPLSNFFQTWFTYNAYLVNMGSWVQDVPGWLSYGEPGRMMVEPILWIGPTYLYVFYGLSVLGCWILRRCNQRWPGISTLGLIACAFVFAMALDVVLEGLVLMPLGFYEYVGGHLALFPDTYHRFPLHEAPIAGAFFAGLICLRYFKDDRGHVVAERGVDKLEARAGAKTAIRLLAICGIVNVLYLVAYNAPNAVIGANSAAWPKDFQERSYFLNGLCGDGTDRACPGPAVPLSRGESSAYLTPDGGLGTPDGYQPPAPVPFQRESAAPFSGPIF